MHSLALELQGVPGWPELLAFGCYDYWADQWNALDGCIVIMSLAEIGLPKDSYLTQILCISAAKASCPNGEARSTLFIFLVTRAIHVSSSSAALSKS